MLPDRHGMSDTLSAPQRLSPDHHIDTFSCGIPELDRWLRERALRNERNDASRTFVLCRGQRVVGYYALAAGSVARVEVPKAIARNTPNPIPVILLGRLAIDQSKQGSGLGGALLRDALIRALNVASAIGARALMVDAISDDAVSFYRRYEFRPSPIHERMLFLPMSFIRQQFEEAVKEL